MNNADTVTL